MKLSKIEEYKILDTSDGMKLESWNGIKLLRPDPEIIWKDKDKTCESDTFSGVYGTSEIYGYDDSSGGPVAEYYNITSSSGMIYNFSNFQQNFFDTQKLKLKSGDWC